ncbi:hypothetical protein GCM10017744_001860 [Streptomyces antimycoticus]
MLSCPVVGTVVEKEVRAYDVETEAQDVESRAGGRGTAGGRRWSGRSPPGERLTGGGARPAAPSAEPEGPALSVDTTTGRKAIDPHIYGINFADEALAKELRLPVRRWGGNATTRYNYKLDAYNAGADWYFENLYYENGTADLPNGSEADKFVEQNRRTGTDTVLTVPMSGWTTAARNAACGFSIATYGPQKANDAQWRPDCGNGVKTDGTNVTGNDPPRPASPPVRSSPRAGWSI